MNHNLANTVRPCIQDDETMSSTITSFERTHRVESIKLANDLEEYFAPPLVQLFDDRYD